MTPEQPSREEAPDGLPLLERERELAQLGRILRDAQQGDGRVALIEGDPGIGKTSLLRAAAASASELGFACFRARAGELERDFAYGCVRQLLEPTLAKTSDSDRGRLLAGAAGLSKPLFAPAEASGLLPSADPSFSIVHGLFWLLNNLADERPVLLSVDDLHWADAESLRFVNYLAPRLDGLRIALVASIRTGEKGSAPVARLAADPATTILRLRPLSAAGTAALCERQLGVDVRSEFAAACWQAAGGNPFYLETLLRDVDEQQVTADADGAARVRRMGPAAVAHAVLLRLEAAPAAAGALVRAVAVLGDGATLADAALLAGVSGEQAAHSADLLAAHKILKHGEPLEFAHPIVREAIYADIGYRQRAEAHGRAATILAAREASEERVAAQIIQAEPAGDADRVALLRRVAADALARGAPAAAVRLLRRALAEPPPSAPRTGVLLDLGRAELRIAAPEALDHLAAAVKAIQEPQLLTTSVRLLGNALTWGGQSDRAVEALASALDVVEPVDRELALLLEADLAAHAQEASLDARAPATSRLERHAGLQGATRGERLVLASLAFERARASESAAAAAAHLERALACGRLLGEQELDVPPPVYTLVVGLLGTEALDVADAVLDRMLADAHRIGSIPAIAFVLAHQGVAAMRRGAVARAESDARTALELLVSHGITLGVELAVSVLVEALAPVSRLA